MVAAGAAVELGYVAALAQASVGEDEDSIALPPEARDGGRPANWGNMFALMVGDFLFSQAYARSARIDPEVSLEIASSLARASEGHVRTLRNAFNPDITPEEHVDLLRQKAAPLFELPCRLGARLCSATAREVRAVSSYGRHLGVAYHLIDDVLHMTGRASPLSRAVGSEIGEGVYSLPILFALQSETRGEMRQRLARLRETGDGLDSVYQTAAASGGVAASLERAEREGEAARRALEALEAGPAKTLLLSCVDYVLARAPTEKWVSRAE